MPLVIVINIKITRMGILDCCNSNKEEASNSNSRSIQVPNTRISENSYQSYTNSSSEDSSSQRSTSHTISETQIKNAHQRFPLEKHPGRAVNHQELERKRPQSPDKKNLYHTSPMYNKKRTTKCHKEMEQEENKINPSQKSQVHLSRVTNKVTKTLQDNSRKNLDNEIDEDRSPREKQPRIDEPNKRKFHHQYHQEQARKQHDSTNLGIQPATKSLEKCQDYNIDLFLSKLLYSKQNPDVEDNKKQTEQNIETTSSNHVIRMEKYSLEEVNSHFGYSDNQIVATRSQQTQSVDIINENERKSRRLHQQGTSSAHIEQLRKNENILYESDKNYKQIQNEVNSKTNKNAPTSLRYQQQQIPFQGNAFKDNPDYNLKQSNAELRINHDTRKLLVRSGYINQPSQTVQGNIYEKDRTYNLAQIDANLLTDRDSKKIEFTDSSYGQGQTARVGLTDSNTRQRKHISAIQNCAIESILQNKENKNDLSNEQRQPILPIQNSSNQSVQLRDENIRYRQKIELPDSNTEQRKHTSTSSVSVHQNITTNDLSNHLQPTRNIADSNQHTSHESFKNNHKHQLRQTRNDDNPFLMFQESTPIEQPQKMFATKYSGSEHDLSISVIPNENIHTNIEQSSHFISSLNYELENNPENFISNKAIITNTVVNKQEANQDIIEDSILFIDSDSNINNMTICKYSDLQNENNNVDQSLVHNNQIHKEEFAHLEKNDFEAKDDESVPQQAQELSNQLVVLVPEDPNEEKFKTEMANLRKQAAQYEEELDNFNGTSSHPKYYYIEENLTRILFKLDKLDVEYSDHLRAHRRKVIKYIYDLLENLEDKAAQPATEVAIEYASEAMP